MQDSPLALHHGKLLFSASGGQLSAVGHRKVAVSGLSIGAGVSLFHVGSGPPYPPFLFIVTDVTLVQLIWMSELLINCQ